MRRGRTDPTRQSGSTCEDARFVISHLSSAIANADTKAALVSPAVGLLITAGFGQREQILNAFPPHHGPEWLAAAAFITSGISVAATLVSLLYVLRPSVVTSSFSRYSWPSIADSSLPGLVSTENRTEREEAWQTALVLSGVVRKKFSGLRFALTFWIVATLSLTIGIFAAR